MRPVRPFAPWPLLALLLFALSASGCRTTTNLITGESARGAYTWQQEVQIGREADPQIVAQFGLLENEALTAYVDRLSRNVLETSAYTDPNTPAEIRETPFFFRVLDTPTVNAFALPGGYIYVTRGLLTHLNNEAQLAFVLGHEIGHVLGRHASRQAARAQVGQLGLIGAAILGDVLRPGLGSNILEFGGTGAQLLFLRWGRDAEREADRAGVAYSSFAGYDAAEGAAFFRSLQRLSSQQGGSLPSFLSTHPDPGQREQAIPALAAQFESENQVFAERYLQAIDGLVIGENPREGFVENNVFYHPDLRFRFSVPQGWRLVNERQSVTLASQNGQVVAQLTLPGQASAQAAAQAFRARQGIAVTDSRSVQVNGLPAVALAGNAQTQGGAVSFLAYFIEHEGRTYQFLGYSPSAVFAANQQGLDNLLRSFARLTDPQFLSRQPVRLEIVRVGQSATFASLLEGRPMPPGMSAEGLAIMNQVELQQQIPAGTRLKLPRRP
ncbi:MAG: M48 family metalloprotease [Rubricoccaceae bacterium]